MLWVGFAMLWVFRLEIVTFSQRTICLKYFLLWVANALAKWSSDIPSWDFPDNPVVKTLHSNTGGVGSVLGCWAKILYVSGPENQKRKKKRKTNKPWNRSNIVTNPIKTLKMVYTPPQKRNPYCWKAFPGAEFITLYHIDLINVFMLIQINKQEAVIKHSISNWTERPWFTSLAVSETWENIYWLSQSMNWSLRTCPPCSLSYIRHSEDGKERKQSLSAPEFCNPVKRNKKPMKMKWQYKYIYHHGANFTGVRSVCWDKLWIFPPLEWHRSCPDSCLPCLIRFSFT